MFIKFNNKWGTKILENLAPSGALQEIRENYYLAHFETGDVIFCTDEEQKNKPLKIGVRFINYGINLLKIPRNFSFSVEWSLPLEGIRLFYFYEVPDLKSFFAFLPLLKKAPEQVAITDLEERIVNYLSFQDNAFFIKSLFAVPTEELINYQTKENGETLLFAVTRNNDLESVKSLLLFGADPLIENVAGDSPYSYVKKNSANPDISEEINKFVQKEFESFSSFVEKSDPQDIRKIHINENLLDFVPIKGFPLLVQVYLMGSSEMLSAIIEKNPSIYSVLPIGLTLKDFLLNKCPPPADKNNLKLIQEYIERSTKPASPSNQTLGEGGRNIDRAPINFDDTVVKAKKAIIRGDINDFMELTFDKVFDETTKNSFLNVAQKSKHSGLIVPWMKCLFSDKKNPSPSHEELERCVLLSDFDRSRLENYICNCCDNNDFWWAENLPLLAYEHLKVEAFRLLLLWGAPIPELTEDNFKAQDVYALSNWSYNKNQLSTLKNEFKGIIQEARRKREAYNKVLPAMYQIAATLDNRPLIEELLTQVENWKECVGAQRFNLIDLAGFAKKTKLEAYLKDKGAEHTKKYSDRFGKSKSDVLEDELDSGEDGPGLPPDPISGSGNTDLPGEGSDEKDSSNNQQKPGSNVVDDPKAGSDGLGLPSNPVGDDKSTSSLEDKRKQWSDFVKGLPVSPELKELYCELKSAGNCPTEEISKKYGTVLIERSKRLFEVFDFYLEAHSNATD